MLTLLYYSYLSSVSKLSVENNYQIGKLDLNNIYLLQQVWPVKVREMEKRLKRGDDCFVVSVEGEVVHYSWVQKSGIHSISPAGRKRTVKPNEIWIYHCRTAEKARGKRIYPLVLTHILSNYADKYNRGKAWIYTSQENISSQRGIERAGFLLVKKLKSLKIGNIILPVPNLENEKL